jgi:hypothetical protein
VEDCRSLIANKIKPALGSKRLHTVNARVSEADRAAEYMSALIDTDSSSSQVRARS